MRAALAMVILAACAGPDRPDAPYVQIAMLDDWPPLPTYLDGARAWSPLGFDFGFDDSGLDACPSRWWEAGVTDCQVTLWLDRWEHLREAEGTDAISDIDARHITIDTHVTVPLYLELAAAHEIGHVILHTTEHTAGGIMGGQLSVHAIVEMTDVDKALACRSIGLCI